MTAPDIRAILDELLTRSGYAADALPVDGDLLGLIGLGDLRPTLESLPDTPITITTCDGDPAEALLHISYTPPTAPTS